MGSGGPTAPHLRWQRRACPTCCCGVSRSPCCTFCMGASTRAMEHARSLLRRYVWIGDGKGWEGHWPQYIHSVLPATVGAGAELQSFFFSRSGQAVPPSILFDPAGLQVSPSILNLFAHAMNCSRASRHGVELIHISKSGGTSMCQLADKSGLYNPGTSIDANCLVRDG